MTDDLDADMDDFARYLALPEIGRIVVNALFDDCMAPPPYVEMMDEQQQVWSMRDGNELR